MSKLFEEKALINTEQAGFYPQVFNWVLGSMPLIVFVIDSAGVFQFSKGQALNALGLEDDQVVGLDYRHVYAAYPEILQQIKQAFAGEITECSSLVSGRHYQLIYRRLSYSNSPLLVGIALDQTELVDTQVLANQVTSELLQAYEISQQGMWAWNITTNQVEHNQAWRAIFGYTEQEDTSDLTHFSQRVHPDDLDRVMRGVQKALDSGEAFQHTYRIVTPSGERLVRDAGKVVHYAPSGEPLKMIGSLIDLTDVFETQKKLKQLLKTDQLTGLGSRYAAEVYWNRTIKSNEAEFAFVLFDIQGFKLVNDVLGHHVGDLLLQKVANHLRASFAQSTHISRIHKDDFLVILPFEHLDELQAFVKHTLESLKQIQVVRDYPLQLSARAGLSLFPDQGEQFNALFHCAETALYHAKQQPGCQSVVYDPAFAAQSKHYLSLLSQIQTAQQNQEFYLVFQPQVAISSGRCVGAEVLMRWKTRQGEWIPPNVFIPIAEQSGLIIPMTYWLIDKSLSQLKLWHELGSDAFYLAVNLPLRFLSEPDIVGYLIQRLAFFGLPHRCLELELTESELLDEGNQHALNNIRLLAQAGFLIAVDDFGTGYSNLAQLRKLAVNKLKIDKSFVDDLGKADSQDMHAITQAVLAMAKALKLNVVAEGVETAVQKEWLEAQGCELVQGYFYAKPMEEEAFLEFLMNGFN